MRNNDTEQREGLKMGRKSTFTHFHASLASQQALLSFFSFRAVLAVKPLAQEVFYLTRHSRGVKQVRTGRGTRLRLSVTPMTTWVIRRLGKRRARRRGCLPRG